MRQRKNKGYLLWIFLVLFVLTGCGKQNEQTEQNEQREIPILPDNIPKKFLEQSPNYEEDLIYENEVAEKMEEWEWEGEASFEIEKRKEQKGAWIAYYPVFSSSSYPEEAKKINESLEAYLKSFQETYFEEQWSKTLYEKSEIYKDVFFYMLTFDVTYDSKEEVSIRFRFFARQNLEWIWEEEEDGWKDPVFINLQSQTFYIFIPSGELFPYQSITRYVPSFEDGYIKDDIILESHENEVSSYQIERVEEEVLDDDEIYDEVEKIIWVYPQLKGEGEQIEKINADIKKDYGILRRCTYGWRDRSLPTQNNYYITYNDEQVISILYEYASWFQVCDTIRPARAGFYNAIYDLNTGEKIRYEDLIDESLVYAFSDVLEEMYAIDEYDIEGALYEDALTELEDRVYYLRENEISFLGYGDFGNIRLGKLNSIEEITIPYVLAKQIKTDHPIWDWLLRTK